MKYQFLTTRELEPLGWMKRQLELEAEGLCGNLDKIWPDVRDSAWIGGTREGWERVPYWLDGFIPLAFLLKNEDMIARAKRYIDAILAAQHEDGWICPNGDTPRKKYDLWAVHLISKVLVVWYDCTEDPRIPEVLYRIMKNLYDQLMSHEVEIFDWAKYRWFEGFIALNRLAALFPNEEWISGLAHYLKETGADYTEVTEAWKRPMNRWAYDTHIVNLAMMLKTEAVSCDLLGNSYTHEADRLDAVLSQYNATPVGIYTGDECLSGLSPIQGSELCSVVEMMYSMEWLYAYTGDSKWAERLERIAFNALPAAFTDDMWAHQYVQMSNQIGCVPQRKSVFRTNNGEAHIFGLEPHFGCCTANFGQGWPKLMLSAFFKCEDGLHCAVPLPSQVQLTWEGTPITVTLETEYPFRNKFVWRIKTPTKTAFRLHIRIPTFAKRLTVNGKPARNSGSLSFGGFEAGETVIRTSFEVEPRLEKSPIGLCNATYGSLVFSLPIEKKVHRSEYTKAGVERKYPYCDYHFSAASDWNYGYASAKLSVEERARQDGIPFSSQHPCLVLHATLSHVDWDYADGYDTVCAKLPMRRSSTDAPQVKALFPYGCAKLRMTEMPLVRGRSK